MIRAKWLEKVNPVALRVDCPRCKQPAGEMCRLVKPKHTRAGNKRTEALGPHFERLTAARTA